MKILFVSGIIEKLGLYGEGFIYIDSIVLYKEILILRFDEDFVMGGLPSDEDAARKANIELDLRNVSLKGTVMDFSILIWKP